MDRPPPPLGTLVAEAGADSTVLLRWSGSDLTSGVSSCDVYVFEAAEGPKLAVKGLTQDSVRVGVRPNSSTGFIAIVRDSAGNRRLMPLAADAIAEWTTPRGTPAGVSGLTTYPSPANLSFSARFQLGERSDVDFGLFDVAGRRVWGETAARQEPGWLVHAINPGTSVHPGVYWLRVSTPRGRMQNRIVLLK